MNVLNSYKSIWQIVLFRLSILFSIPMRFINNTVYKVALKIYKNHETVPSKISAALFNPSEGFFKTMVIPVYLNYASYIFAKPGKNVYWHGYLGYIEHILHQKIIPNKEYDEVMELLGCELKDLGNVILQQVIRAGIISQHSYEYKRLNDAKFKELTDALINSDKGYMCKYLEPHLEPLPESYK